MSQFYVRLLRTALTLWGVVTLTFILGRLTGDPVALLLPQTATVDDYARLKDSLGLNQPLLTQYIVYISNLIQGDFGTSIAYNRSALTVVAERIPATLELGIPSLILSNLLSIPLGVWAAIRRNKFTDRVIMTFSLAGQALPSFFIGIVLILIFGVQLGLTPTFGRDTFAHLILPTITLTIYPLAFLIRLTRSSMLEVLQETYINTARAKGLRPSRIIFVHALRNALIPVVTIIGLQIAGLISGSAIVETVFAWPGIGLLAVYSIGARDYPVIQTIVLISAMAFSITSLAVDSVYILIDPRIRVR